MLIVQKFGGTSVGSVERIKENVVGKVKKELELGNQVVVVVSAMSGETDRLLKLAGEFASQDASNQHIMQEYDSIVSTGEQVSSGLTALALQSEGIASRSVLGWQVKITTNDAYGKARIEGIDAEKIKELLKQKIVPIIPGFQGVSSVDERITTLGRGGSDTSAVALAAALKADRCDIYTDVVGVFSADPRLVSNAKKLDKISYEEMLEMASSGSKVLQVRSVEMAMKYEVPTQVLSSFNDEDGTLLTKETKEMEKHTITAVTSDKNEARISVTHVPDLPGKSAAIFKALADISINVDLIIQSTSVDDTGCTITFTCGKTDVTSVVKILEAKRKEIGFQNIIVDEEVVKVSLVGIGMKTHAGVAGNMFDLLARNGVNIIAISTSEIKITVLISAKYHELAVRVLHDEFVGKN